MFTLKKKLSKKSSSYYSSIYECPIYCWEKAKENYNTAFLKPENLYVNPKNVKLDKDNEGDKTFLAFLTEIFDEFGMSKELEEELKIKQELINAYLDYNISGDRSLLNAVNIHKKKLESKLLSLEDKTVKFGEELAVVSKSLGALIDPKSTSVYMYYSAKTNVSNGK